MNKLADIFKSLKGSSSQNIYDPWVGQNSTSICSDVCFLNYVNNKCVGNSDDDYARGVSSNWNIHHPLERHQQLINAGFLIPATPSITLQKLKISELKDIVRKYNLPSTGKKQDLIQIIVDNIPITALNISPVYILSSKGQKYINNYHYYIDVQKYLSCHIFTLQEFETVKASQPYLSVDDIVWRLYSDKYSYYSSEFQHGTLRNINFYRYKFELEHGHNKDALAYLIATLYFDINGTSKFHNYSDYSVIDYFSENIHELASEYDSSVLNKVFRIADSAIEMSRIATTKPFWDNKLLILYETFSRNIFEQIVQELLDGNTIDLEKYRQYANPNCL